MSTTDDDVRRLALALPEVVEGASYGTPAYRVDGTVFARIHEEPGVLMLWCGSLEQKDRLLAEERDALFTTDHYRGHASVLVRLEQVGPERLDELLRDAWEARAPRRLREERPEAD